VEQPAAERRMSTTNTATVIRKRLNTPHSLGGLGSSSLGGRLNDCRLNLRAIRNDAKLAAPLAAGAGVLALTLAALVATDTRLRLTCRLGLDLDRRLNCVSHTNGKVCGGHGGLLGDRRLRHHRVD
jgi:hypothetical protein